MTDYFLGTAVKSVKTRQEKIQRGEDINVNIGDSSLSMDP